MEKIKPIDQKLRYQIEKLLRMSENGDTSKQKDDPLRFKPNFASLDDNEDDDELGFFLIIFFLFILFI